MNKFTFCFCLLFICLHSCSFRSDVLCQLTAPYASWIGSHNITLTWKALNQSDVVYIPQWTGPRLSGVWTQGEVDICDGYIRLH